MLKEIRREPIRGIPMVIALTLVILATSVAVPLAFVGEHFWFGLGLIALLVVECVCLAGFFRVAPNEAQVLQLFGRYVGTAHDPGLRWAKPFFTKHKVSLRIRNFETAKLKVNANHGNPVEIGCVVVWKVFDTAEAVFEG